jgi:iron(III) transport system permease protein
MANMSGVRGRFKDYALLWGLLGVVGVLSVLPPARLLVEGAMPGGAVSGDALRRVLSQSATWTATGHSLLTAFGGTTLAVLIGGAVALTVSLTDIRARNGFVFCYVMPLMLAPQVVALAWLQMFGPSSPFLKLLGVAPALGTRNPLYSPGESSSCWASSMRRWFSSRCAQGCAPCRTSCSRRRRPVGRSRCG